ncbi:MAG: hypothetical protein WC821_00695 [archaeon]
MPRNFLSKAYSRARVKVIKRVSKPTQQNRLRVDAKIISRGLLTLFNPSMSLSQADAVSKATAKKVYLTSFMFGRKYDGTYFPLTGHIRVNKKDFTFSRRTSIIAHELIHKQLLGKGDPIWANSFGGYFGFIFPLTRNQHGKSQIKPKNPLDLKAWARNEALFGENGKTEITLVEKDIKKLSSQPYIREYKTEKLVPESPNGLGYRIGTYALAFEIRFGKPGIGLMILKETANGTPFSLAVRNAEEGKYDQALNSWKEKNPFMNKYLQLFYAQNK